MSNRIMSESINKNSARMGVVDALTRLMALYLMLPIKAQNSKFMFQLESTFLKFTRGRLLNRLN